jgi:hypothetical protein
MTYTLIKTAALALFMASGTVATAQRLHSNPDAPTTSAKAFELSFSELIISNLSRHEIYQHFGLWQKPEAAKRKTKVGKVQAFYRSNDRTPILSHVEKMRLTTYEGDSITRTYTLLSDMTTHDFIYEETYRKKTKTRDSVHVSHKTKDALTHFNRVGNALLDRGDTEMTGNRKREHIAGSKFGDKVFVRRYAN